MTAPTACRFIGRERPCSLREGHEGAHAILVTRAEAEAAAPDGLREALERLRIPQSNPDYTTRYGHGWNDAIRNVLGSPIAAPAPALDVERAKRAADSLHLYLIRPNLHDIRDYEFGDEIWDAFAAAYAEQPAGEK